MDPHLEELLGLVVWLTTCGRSELKVFDSITYPQLEGFRFHQESSGGCFSGSPAGLGCALMRLCTLAHFSMHLCATLGSDLALGLGETTVDLKSPFT